MLLTIKNDLESKLTELFNLDKLSNVSDSYPIPFPDSTLYDCERDSREQQLIEVQKIAGGNPLRIDCNRTWLENLNTIDRMEGLINGLSTSKINNLDKLSAFYLKDQSSAIDVYFFNDIDRYFVLRGSHRTILAKVTNVKWLKARITYLKFNKKLYEDKMTRIEKENIEKEEFSKGLQLLDARISKLYLKHSYKIGYRPHIINIPVYYENEYLMEKDISEIYDITDFNNFLEEVEELILAKKAYPSVLALLNIRYRRMLKNTNFQVREFMLNLSKTSYFNKK